MAVEDLEQQKVDYFNNGGAITTGKPGQKPSGKTLDFPLSGGRTTTIHSYPSARERSPLVKLLMLTPSGGGIQISCGSGGIAWLTREDVAGALAAPSPTCCMWNGADMRIENEKLSKQAYYYALARYIEDDEALTLTKHHAWMLAVEFAIKHQWKTVRGSDTLRNAAMIALGNVMGMPALTHCEKCNGSGNNQQGQCKRCQGSGKSQPSMRKLSRLMGRKDHKNIKTVWIPRIQRIETIIRRWERDVVNHLYFQFAKDQDH